MRENQCKVIASLDEVGHWTDYELEVSLVGDSYLPSSACCPDVAARCAALKASRSDWGAVTCIQAEECTAL